jgi:hypothetical protein
MFDTVYRTFLATNENGENASVKVEYDATANIEEFLEGLPVFIKMSGSRYLPEIDLLPPDDKVHTLHSAPLYAYIHGNVALSIDSPFSCSFDSGRCGTVWYKDDAELALLNNTIETLQDLINGDVYSISVDDNPTVSSGVFESEIDEIAMDMVRNVLSGDTITLVETN